MSKQEIVSVGVLSSTKKPNLDTYDKFCPKFLEYVYNCHFTDKTKWLK